MAENDLARKILDALAEEGSDDAEWVKHEVARRAVQLHWRGHAFIDANLRCRATAYPSILELADEEPGEFEFDFDFSAMLLNIERQDAERFLIAARVELDKFAKRNGVTI